MINTFSYKYNKGGLFVFYCFLVCFWQCYFLGPPLILKKSMCQLSPNPLISPYFPSSTCAPKVHAYAVFTLFSIKKDSNHCLTNIKKIHNMTVFQEKVRHLLYWGMDKYISNINLPIHRIKTGMLCDWVKEVN